MTTTLVFDVNETMLDLAAMDDQFEQIFGDSAVRREWFALVLRNALTLTIVGQYSDFVTIAGASLDMVAGVRGLVMSPNQRALISRQMTELPPHPDVPESLKLLKASGLRMAALTNSPPEVATKQLDNADLSKYFDHILSVHAVERLKPHPDVYRHAASAIGATLEEMMMVAAHDWDIAGAMAVGTKGAYVLRQGMARNPLFVEPTVTGDTMTTVAEKILRLTTS